VSKSSLYRSGAAGAGSEQLGPLELAALGGDEGPTSGPRAQEEPGEEMAAGPDKVHQGTSLVHLLFRREGGRHSWSASQHFSEGL